MGWFLVDHAAVEHPPELALTTRFTLAVRRPDTGERLVNTVELKNTTGAESPKVTDTARNLLTMWLEHTEHRLRCDRQEPGAEKFADHDGHCAGTRSRGTYDEPIRAAFAAAQGERP